MLGSEDSEHYLPRLWLNANELKCVRYHTYIAVHHSILDWKVERGPFSKTINSPSNFAVIYVKCDFHVISWFASLDPSFCSHSFKSISFFICFSCNCLTWPVIRDMQTKVPSERMYAWTIMSFFFFLFDQGDYFIHRKALQYEISMLKTKTAQKPG